MITLFVLSVPVLLLTKYKGRGEVACDIFCVELSLLSAAATGSYFLGLLSTLTDPVWAHHVWKTEHSLCLGGWSRSAACSTASPHESTHQGGFLSTRHTVAGSWLHRNTNWSVTNHRTADRPARESISFPSWRDLIFDAGFKVCLWL